MVEKSVVPEWQMRAIDKIMDRQKRPDFFKCEKCGSTEAQITGSPLHLIQLDHGAVGFGKGIFVFSKACRECGYMENYSLTAMDINPPY